MRTYIPASITTWERKLTEHFYESYIIKFDTHTTTKVIPAHLKRIKSVSGLPANVIFK